MTDEIFRGSWIPASTRPNNQIFICPFCGERVYMFRGSPTYPTCPWCVSDMPEMDDFETPEELADRKAGNRAATGRKYCVDPEVNKARNEKLRAYRASLGDKFREQRREYHARNREKINAQQQARYQKNKEKNRKRPAAWRTPGRRRRRKSTLP